LPLRRIEDPVAFVIGQVKQFVISFASVASLREIKNASPKQHVLSCDHDALNAETRNQEELLTCASIYSNSLKLPLFTSALFTLRDLKQEDAPAISTLRSIEEVNQYIERAKALTEEGALAFINKMRAGIEAGQWYYWAIASITDDKLIGTMCLWNFSEDKKTAEIGYELHPSYQGKGIVREALSLIIDYAFKELGLENIQAYTHLDNERSKLLLEKNNFKSADRSGNFLIYKLTINDHSINKKQVS
jgi:[ribosomal protein S5]-alanine N-acetyltransferase